MTERLASGRRTIGRVFVGAAVALAVVGSIGIATVAAAPETITFDEERLEFEPGTDNAIRDGHVAVGSSDRWVLRARAGQTFAITIDSADDNTVFSVFSPDRRLLVNVTPDPAQRNLHWTGVLPADGDYSVELASLEGSDYYQMKVWIDAINMDPLGLVDRISFRPGDSSGSASSSVIRASTDSWLLTARAGQTMDVTVINDAGGVTFDVHAPDGTPLTAPGERTTWTGVLPVDGDYRVAVSPLMGNQAYDIVVSIHGGGGGEGGVVGDGPYEPDPAVDNPDPDPVVLDEGGIVQRISFEPGADHAIISNALAPGMADTFILGAASGQQLNAWVESDTGEVTVAAFDPNGEVLRSAGFDVYVEVLPFGGDYELEVWNQSSIVSAYTLTVYIT